MKLGTRYYSAFVLIFLTAGELAGSGHAPDLDSSPLEAMRAEFDALRKRRLEAKTKEEKLRFCKKPHRCWHSPGRHEPEPRSERIFSALNEKGIANEEVLSLVKDPSANRLSRSQGTLDLHYYSDWWAYTATKICRVGLYDRIPYAYSFRRSLHKAEAECAAMMPSED